MICDPLINAVDPFYWASMTPMQRSNCAAMIAVATMTTTIALGSMAYLAYHCCYHCRRHSRQCYCYFAMVSDRLNCYFEVASAQHSVEMFDRMVEFVHLVRSYVAYLNLIRALHQLPPLMHPSPTLMTTTTIHVALVFGVWTMKMKKKICDHLGEFLMQIKNWSESKTQRTFVNK